MIVPTRVTRVHNDMLRQQPRRRAGAASPAGGTPGPCGPAGPWGPGSPLGPGSLPHAASEIEMPTSSIGRILIGYPFDRHAIDRIPYGMNAQRLERA